MVHCGDLAVCAQGSRGRLTGSEQGAGGAGVFVFVCVSGVRVLEFGFLGARGSKIRFQVFRLAGRVLAHLVVLLHVLVAVKQQAAVRHGSSFDIL